jgi:hypothetical protein
MHQSGLSSVIACTACVDSSARADARPYESADARPYARADARPYTSAVASAHGAARLMYSIGLRMQCISAEPAPDADTRRRATNPYSPRHRPPLPERRRLPLRPPLPAPPRWVW